MCIIAFKKKGLDLAKKSVLKTMWDNNPDGAGYMIKKNGYVIIHKGFMFFDDFMDALQSENNLKDYDVALHFRIETSGGICPQMTHPFIAKDNKTKLKSTLRICTKDLVIMHNGVISVLNGISQNLSDTALFAKNILSDSIIKENIFKSKSLQFLVENAIDGSRMLLFNHQQEPLMLGKWHESNGIYYSNESFKSKKKKTKLTNWSYNDYEFDNNFDYDFDYDFDNLDEWSGTIKTTCDSCKQTENCFFSNDYYMFFCKDCANYFNITN